ncbi:MAG: ATP synthase F1 subunit gamma [Tannerella sp.]|jgi:F-type H+-transporting ATPase subunit gamma|nr:ATP synthase F1 subunit gamma [Tannerella sp.]
MAAFKEIKKRINSIKSTRKTTSAMKMVSSAKLHKAEKKISDMRPYAEALHRVMESLLAAYSPGDAEDAEDGRFAGLTAERPVRNVAIVAFSSDSSLCGAFNSNVFRELRHAVDAYRQPPANGNVFVYTIGRKIYDAVRKTDTGITGNFENLAGKPDYSVIAELADSLIRQFEKREIDRVELVYHHFKSAGSQQLIREPLLPVAFRRTADCKTEYICEPSRGKLSGALMPKCVRLHLYAALLDSNVSEHAARMVAMQTATDNADDLVGELTVEYNKSRQQAITNELSDIAGGKTGGSGGGAK